VVVDVFVDVAEDCTDPADGHGLLIEHSRQIVPLRAREHVVPIDQRESAAMTRPPGGLGLYSVELDQRLTTQTPV
jgi:hypothetical protein